MGKHLPGLAFELTHDDFADPLEAHEMGVVEPWLRHATPDIAGKLHFLSVDPDAQDLDSPAMRLYIHAVPLRTAKRNRIRWHYRLRS